MNRKTTSNAVLAPIGMLGALILWTGFAGTGLAQPPHPRLLFTPSQIPAIQAKVAVAGSIPANAWAQCASTASLQTQGSLPSISAQSAWVVQRSLRRMTEAAFRYAVFGDSAAGQSARSMLVSLPSILVPNGASGYQMGSYASSLALTYDMIHGLMSSSERASVANHILAWVYALQTGTNALGGYGVYTHCTDNFSFAWSTGIALGLMAVWGDVSYSNITGVIQTNMSMLNSGWRDAISPDGTVDEAYGYTNYGQAYSMIAGIAAQNCGLGDYLSGTNIPNLARWVGTSVFGNSFFWHGDSSPSHKGMRMDPVLYYSAMRSNRPEDLWALQRVYNVEQFSDSTSSQAFSPYLNAILFYPSNLTPQPPEVLSGFFRDNLNEAPSTINHTVNFYNVGNGGQAMLHNSPLSSWSQFGAFYMIKDEWTNHGHEDDGALCLSSQNVHFYMDLGYAATNFAYAQSTDHNIVLVQGEAGYRGNSNNYYSAPTTDARFLGAKKALLLSREMDYVRGEHAAMWMMQRAERSVIMIKDPSSPYMILVDRCDKDGTNRTYEEVFHSAAPASGSGTASSPMTISANGATLRATYLSPSSVTVSPGSGQTSSAGIVNYRNRVIASGTDVTFVSVQGKDAATNRLSLTNPLPGTAGGTIVWPLSNDKILVKSGSSSTIGDSQSTTDGNFAWIRMLGTTVAEWSVGEGTNLVHNGLSLMNANTPVVASVRMGRVAITTVNGSPASALVFTGSIPFPVTQLTVNGTSTNFTQNGSTVTVGQSVPLPAESQDRIYSFCDSFSWDAAFYGNAYMTAAGRVTSGLGWAGFHLRGGASLTARPMALGMDVRFLNGASGPEAEFICESAGYLADVFKIDLEPLNTTSFQVRVIQTGQAIQSFQMPLSSLTNHGRMTAVYHPVQGTLTFETPAGMVIGTANVAPRTAAFRLRCTFTEYAEVDNVTWFDSEEDGSTPQGIAYWGVITGRVGCCVRAPQVLSGGTFTLFHQGQWLDATLANLWLQVAQVYEELYAPYTPVSAQNPGAVRELSFETLNPGVLAQPGRNSGVRFTTATGVVLFDTWTF